MAETKLPIRSKNGKIIDLTGKTYGHLLVLSFDGCRNRRAHWVCLCACGEKKTISARFLSDGIATSCGCLTHTKLVKASTKHGKCRTPEYGVWSGLKARCLNPKSGNFYKYGARGIAVCQEWQTSFEQFLFDMGPRPSRVHSIERIDNDLGYFKGNCRWATRQEQSRNKRNTVFIIHNGSRTTIDDAAASLGIRPRTLRGRIQNGWSVERALSTPVKKRTSKSRDINVPFLDRPRV